ncbi:hypothetical protein [Gordonia crocea]|uniref:Uncharacterized protein n=1 Tax=Gordonia crocea TaxID=589162 RepID=A0A7I9UV89_9ACTN|nr:hypothetical protein [Gordonia crocea]GED97055.1 hypothetical protein nbrc107697_10940 [Gordonia crocea]
MLGFRMRAAVSVAAAAGLAVGPVGLPAASAAPTPINGLFAITPGACSGGTVTGSYFRMILPAGTTAGPFLANGDSACSDKTITPLSPGSAGGLRSGAYQPQPAAAFDAAGNALSGSVTRPVKFYGVGFATATNQVDPQTRQRAGTPVLYHSGGEVTGDLSAFGVTWNKQVFNQGAPKPGGGLPGKTSPVRGKYNPQTGDYAIEWTSQIVGGPFNNFTGLWRLTGRATATGAAAAPGQRGAAAPGAPGAPAVPGAPAAPGAPVTVTAAPPVVNNTITVAPTNRGFWQGTAGIATLLAIVALATALLTNADRLVRRYSAHD